MACKGPPIPSIPPNPQQQTTDNVLYFWFVLSCVLCLARLLTYYYIGFQLLCTAMLLSHLSIIGTQQKKNYYYI